MPAKSFKDLVIWQRSIRLVEDIYEATGEFPKEELYGFSAQLRRGAVSIPSNMAEGFARRHNA
jgi:four helix bundle protein